MESIKRVLAWLAAHKWALAAAALVGLLACGVWARHLSSERELGSLREAYAQSLAQVRTLEAQTERLRRELDAQTARIQELQAEHDRRIREAGTSAYRKARSMADSDVVDGFNSLIDSARQRNAERERGDLREH